MIFFPSIHILPSVILLHILSESHQLVKFLSIQEELSLILAPAILLLGYLLTLFILVLFVGRVYLSHFWDKMLHAMSISFTIVCPGFSLRPCSKLLFLHHTSEVQVPMYLLLAFCSSRSILTS